MILLLCLLMNNAHAWWGDDADIWEQGEKYDEKTRHARAELGLIERIDIPIEQQAVTEKGVEVLTAQAESGDTDAQWRLCTVYLYGRAAASGIMADEKQALHWCKEGAEQGNARAQYWLATIYGSRKKNTALYGEQIWELDREQTLYWLTRSAEQGDYLAQYALGLMYKGRLTYKQGYQGPMRIPNRLNLSEPKRLMMKFKWTCLAWGNGPPKSWIIPDAKRQCYGFSTERISASEKAEMHQMIETFKPKHDAEAKAIADALVPEIAHQNDVAMKPDSNGQKTPLKTAITNPSEEKTDVKQLLEQFQSP